MPAAACKQKQCQTWQRRGVMLLIVAKAESRLHAKSLVVRAWISRLGELRCKGTRTRRVTV